MRARDLPEDEQAIVEAVARWVDREVRPHAGRLERAEEYPGGLIEQMKEMGVFGLAVPRSGATPRSPPAASRWSPRSSPAAG
jgi:alkylation response protein AidB-like acyl-CoA dehydrogenase